MIFSHELNQQIYNLDVILSFLRLLIEALAFTNTEQIELLPAWPENYPDGNIKGIHVYGGDILDMSWKNNKFVYFTIHGDSDGLCMVSHRETKKQIKLKIAKTKILKFDLSNHSVSSIKQ